MKFEKIEKIMILGLYGALITVFLSIVCVKLTDEILMEKLGVDNSFVKMMYWYNDGDNTIESLKRGFKAKYIDWGKIYPFEMSAAKQPSKKVKSIKLTQQITNKAKQITQKIKEEKGRINTRATNNLIGYYKISEIRKAYEEILGWHITFYKNIGYNNRSAGVVKLSDDYLVWERKSALSGKLIDSFADNTARLHDYCNKLGVNLIYVQAPYKTCKYDTDIRIKNFDSTNKNMDNLLGALKKRKIPYIDLREYIHKQNLNHHELFFKTDHHWKPETALWAADIIVEELSKRYNFQIKDDLLDRDNFRYERYENLFLGSQGRVVTLAQTELENVALIYPKYATRFNFIVPNIDINKIGDFSIIYDNRILERRIKNINYYNMLLTLYGMYCYGDKPLHIIKNLQDNQHNNKKILIIHDSFAISCAPFIALEAKEIDMLDGRHFNGSVKSYIKTNKPDIVILMYTGDMIGLLSKKY